MTKSLLSGASMMKEAFIYFALIELTVMTWEDGMSGRARWQRKVSRPHWAKRMIDFHAFMYMSCRKNVVFSHMDVLNGDQHGVVKGLRPSPLCSIFYGPVVENSMGSVR